MGKHWKGELPRSLRMFSRPLRELCLLQRARCPLATQPGWLCYKRDQLFDKPDGVLLKSLATEEPAA